MARALRTAAIVVGGAALIATGIGAAAAIGAFGTVAAGSATATFLATAATVAKVAGFAAAALSLASMATTPKGTVGGNPTKFKIDKDAGIPLIIGRTLSGGNVVHRQFYDDPGSKMRNQRESWVAVHSLGPVKSIGPLLVDKAPVNFDAAGAALGSYRGNMWLDTQLGACPEPRALRGPTGDFPGWNASSKLSGLAADLWTLDYDSKGVKYPNGVPDRARVIEGFLWWDPRLDSTYPGGMGPCRRGDPSTHVYSECPWIVALNFALGLFQNGQLVAGGGMKLTGVDVNSFVQAANVADANGWKAGGIIYTMTDNDWDSLKMMAQAGGGELQTIAGTLSCTWSAPRVSIATITSADVIGDVDAPSTASARKRRNTIIPKVRLEEQGWEVVPLAPVTVPAYALLDGATRPREITYPLVQQATQGAQLAMYDMLNDRELDPIVLPLRIDALGYLPGDCVTLDIPEASLINRPVVLRTRELDGSTFGVTFTARTEDVEKHAFALGKTGVPPRTPDLSIAGPDLSAPTASDWSAAGATLTDNGLSVPAIVVTGAAPRGAVEAVLFELRVHQDGRDAEAGWAAVGLDSMQTVRKEITGVTPGTTYDVSLRYRVRGVLGDRLILPPVVAGSMSLGGSLIVARSVETRAIAQGAVTDTSIFENGDQYIPGDGNEYLLIETPSTFLGGDGYSRALCLMSGVLEPQSSDAGATISIYADYGEGYQFIRSFSAGARASGSGSNVYFRMPIVVPFSISTVGNVRFAVRGKTFNLGGGFSNSFVRSIRIDVLRGAR